LPLGAAPLLGLYVLSTLLLGCPQGEDVLLLLSCGVPTCGPCDLAATYLVRNRNLARSPTGWMLDSRALDKQVAALDGADGQVDLPGRPWSGALALRGPGGLQGYLVVSAHAVPAPDVVLRLRLFARHAGTAVAAIGLRHKEVEHTRQLGTLVRQLAETRKRLTASVAALERQTTIRRALGRRTGEQAIADAVHDLTGLAVAVEDPFGNLRCWSGPEQEGRYPKPEPSRRDDVLRQAVRQGRPVRDKDTLVALARPRQEILGALVLIGEQDDVGPQELLALEEGAAALGWELAHQRDLVEVEARLRGDLVHDLVTGGDPDGAVGRAEAIGHDLDTPHQVVAVDWSGATHAHDTVTRATNTLGIRCLSGSNGDMVVLVAASPVPATDLYDLLCRELGSTGGAVGVGGRADSVAELPRSFGEATRALELRRDSRAPDGLSMFDELGLYRILHAGQDSAEIERYVREWLGPLLEYDDRHHADLTNTLFRYLECGGNYTTTANTLRIHRSTLRYRLRRIRDVGDIDFHDVDSRLNLHVAARAWHLLAVAGSSNPVPLDVRRGNC
jgi:sugar diacid utilization regulator